MSKEEEKKEKIEKGGDDSLIKTLLANQAEMRKMLEEEREKRKETEQKLEMLSASADKGRIAAWEAKNKDRLIPQVKLSIYEGDIVVAWKMTKNEVFVDTQGKIHEDQKINLFLQNKEAKIRELEIPYVEWARKTSVVIGDLIERRKNNETGEEKIIIKLPEFGDVEVSPNFVNPF